MKKNNLIINLRCIIFSIALLFSMGYNKNKRDFPDKEKAYKIETQYSGEILVDSCIVNEKLFFPNGQYMEILHHKPGIRTSLYDGDGRPIMVLLEYNNEYEKTYYTYDFKGNEAELRMRNSYNKLDVIAKRENNYTIDDRIKKQVLYGFNSEIEGINLFHYDTLGYSMIIEKIRYPNTELRTVHYYQNNLLTKITRNFSSNRVFEYSYDTLGRLIFEDHLLTSNRIYYNYDNDSLHETIEITKFGDTLKKTTYEYMVDSLQRPTRINAIVENFGEDIKKQFLLYNINDFDFLV